MKERIGKNIEEFNTTENLFFERIGNIYKPFATSIKKKREKLLKFLKSGMKETLLPI